MSEFHKSNLIADAGGEAKQEDCFARDLTIRVSPHSYFSALLIGTFFSALLFYLELDLPGLLLFVASWILLPFFALNDKIAFDGKRLFRTGLLPKVWSWVHSSRRRLKLTDIEQVETHAVRTARRGGNIYYRYRTVLRGKGLSITIASGGDDFRLMIRELLSRLPENVLATRSIELRDPLADPKETLMRAEFARIPAADVLESSYRHEAVKRRRPAVTDQIAAHHDEEKADDLRSLANQLRVSGYLYQALEAFRRALKLRPADPLLLFEFARCLHSFAGVEHNDSSRAIAALRHKNDMPGMTPMH